MHAVRLGALILLATWLTGCSEPGGTRGVDVSHWQGEVDWSAVAASPGMTSLSVAYPNVAAEFALAVHDTIKVQER